MRIVPDHTDPAPDHHVAAYLAAKREAEAAQDRLKDAQAALLKQMEADQRKSYKWDQDGRRINVTYTVRTTPTIDEVGLRKALTAKVYDKYTIRKLDRRLLEKALDSGEVDNVKVSRYVTMRASEPYLTYRESEINDE